MTPEQIFCVWAPPQSVWSPWVSPVIFPRVQAQEAPATEEDWPEAHWLDSVSGTAAVIDLNSEQSVEWGMALAKCGMRPVPLFNCSPEPLERSFLGETRAAGAVLDTVALRIAVGRATPFLPRLDLAPNAPPAFLLDAMRTLGHRAVAAGMFDNRWMVFPQDFPSARVLREQGIRRVIVLLHQGRPLQTDLSHVLFRWQEAGIEIFQKELNNSEELTRVHVSKPWRFRSVWYRALEIFGLQRSSAGGFGAYIPEEGSGGWG